MNEIFGTIENASKIMYKYNKKNRIDPSGCHLMWSTSIPLVMKTISINITLCGNSHLPNLFLQTLFTYINKWCTVLLKDRSGKAAIPVDRGFMETCHTEPNKTFPCIKSIRKCGQIYSLAYNNRVLFITMI